MSLKNTPLQYYGQNNYMRVEKNQQV